MMSSSSPRPMLAQWAPRGLLLVTLIACAAGPAAGAEPAAAPGAAKGGVAADGIPRTADGEPAHFRVDMHMERDGERVVMRRYVDGPRSRMEAEVEGEKVVILDLGDEQGTTYTLLPSQKRAIKSSIAVANESSAKAEKKAGKDEPSKGEPAPAAGGSDGFEGKLELLGTETIDGKAAEKYRVTTPDGTGLMWVEASTQLPLRMEAQGLTVQMKNYDFSKQPRELFEVPKKYDVLDMDEVMKSLGPGGSQMMSGMGGMMGGMAGQMGGGLGGQLGAGLGASIGGPVGAMVGQYLGQRIGQSVGERAGKAVSPR